MRKLPIIALALAAAITLSLTGCGHGYDAPAADSAPPDAIEPVQVGVGGRSAADDTPIFSGGAPEGPSAEPEAPEPEAPDYRTEDEKLADRILAAGSTKAAAETDVRACVVDVRKEKNPHNPYDVMWDYSDDFILMFLLYIDDLHYVFDAEYYKAAFPMLAIQHQQSDIWLKVHFTTVGIHEGRQGSEHFNVKAYMDSCPDWIREKFGDNYACYYLYWLLSDEVDRSVPVTGENCPKQMTAVLTAVQREELNLINQLRKEVGVEPLVFDSEMGAIANYRAWINAHDNWAAHDWTKQHLPEFWDMMALIDGKGFSENTTSRFQKYYNSWFYGYKNSQAHYDAMVKPSYNFIGCSNAYACANTLERYQDRSSDTRICHFDVFIETLSTALHP